MEYAVIQASGRQYRVKKGDRVVLDNQPDGGDHKIVFDKVLLLVSDQTVTIGQPYVIGARVVGAITSQGKGAKIRVAKFKAKSNYRRVKGFRPLQTTVEIADIKEDQPVSSTAKNTPKTKSPPPSTQLAQ